MPPLIPRAFAVPAASVTSAQARVAEAAFAPVPVLAPAVTQPLPGPRITFAEFENGLSMEPENLPPDRKYYYCKQCTGDSQDKMIDKNLLLRHFSKGRLGKQFDGHSVCGAVCGGCKLFANYQSPLRQCGECVRADPGNEAALFSCEECLDLMHKSEGMHPLTLTDDCFPQDFVAQELGAALVPSALPVSVPAQAEPVAADGTAVTPATPAASTPHLLVIAQAAPHSAAPTPAPAAPTSDNSVNNTSTPATAAAATTAGSDGGQVMTESQRECLNCLQVRNAVVDVVSPLLAQICQKRWEQAVSQRNSQCPNCQTEHTTAHPLTALCIRTLIVQYLQKRQKARASGAVAGDEDEDGGSSVQKAASEWEKSAMHISFQSISDTTLITSELYTQRLDIAATLDLIRLFESLQFPPPAPMVSNELSKQLRGCRNAVFHTNALPDGDFNRLWPETIATVRALRAKMEQSAYWYSADIPSLMTLEDGFWVAKYNYLPRNLLPVLATKIRSESRRQSLDTLVQLIGGDILGVVGVNSLRQARLLCQRKLKHALFIPTVLEAASKVALEEFVEHLAVLIQVGTYKVVYNFNKESTPFTKLFEAKLRANLPALYTNLTNERLAKFLALENTWYQSAWLVVVAGFGPINLTSGRDDMVLLCGQNTSDLHKWCCLVNHEERSFLDKIKEIEDINGECVFGEDSVVDMELVAAYLQASHLKRKGEMLLLPANTSTRHGITCVSAERCSQFAQCLEVLHLHCGSEPPEATVREFDHDSESPLTAADVVKKYRDSIIRSETEKYMRGNPPSWFLVAQNRLLHRESLRVLYLIDK